MTGNYEPKLLEYVPSSTDAHANSAHVPTRAREASKARRARAVSRRGRETFLAALREGRTVTYAAKLTGHDRSRFYELRRSDEAFAGEWEQAVEAGIDVIEDEVARYATEGWDEETFDASGNLVRRVRRRDPRLLARVREWRRPPDATVDVRVGGSGVPVAVEGRAMTSLADVVRFAIEIGQPDILGLPESVIDAYTRSELPPGDVIDADAIAESA